ncbi:cell division protein SepF [Gloeocapsa sp. PCC 73106]|uniref:cell division protein SepF n=1 Tax=Gloeocapsa sp. PCC 73106 TaxID=102232 RepID=UPI0002AC21F7|nr:cell division protein SepF [Gloeocapsa sp. PCC 73106]ELR96399.1 hypothetical protein GLO73106DRAFT_00001920 [Gloeocapsa sp. PCC 73106]
MSNLANLPPLEKNLAYSSSPHALPLTEFSLLKLNSLGDMVQVVEIMRRNKIAIIILSNLEEKTAKRVRDWLNGYIVAVDGISQWLGEQTFLLAAHKIKISGALSQSLINPRQQEAITSKIKKILIKLADNNLLAMISVPGGSFAMGSEPEETPVHPVTVQSFYLSQYPITQAQWRVIAALPQVNKKLDANPAYFLGDNLPVEQVSWEDALEFCARLSQKTGRTYRLPSEAEWEYACRAGTKTRFWFGQDINSDLANYDGNSGYGKDTEESFLKKTTPVDYFGIKNPFGLADLHGNVWEWCADHWHRDYQGAPTDGSAWLSQDEQHLRVVRGGSWYDLPRFCRSACRYSLNAQRKVNNIGFRIACDPIN